MIKSMAGMLSQYRSVISWGLINKIASMGAGFVSVYVINQLFSKSLYGEMAFFQAIFFYILILATFGFDKTIIYKIAHFNRSRSELLGGSLLDRFHLLSIIALLLIECLFIISWAIFSTSEFSNEWFWISLLSINTFFSLSAALYTSFFQANKCPEVAIKISLISTLVKVLVLSFFLIFKIDSLTFFIVYVTLPTLISVGLLYIERKKNTTRELSASIVKDDYFYSCKLMLTKLVHQGVEKIDLLMIGFFLSTDQTAEYAVAAKLALLIGLGNELLGPLLTPQLKYALSTKNRSLMLKEYSYNKAFSLIVGASVLAVYIFFGNNILTTFGSYQASYPVLIILSLSFINGMAFGPNGRLLMMAGYANLSLYTTIMCLVFLILSNYLLIPMYGVLGAALGTYFSIFILNAVIQYFVFRELNEEFNSRWFYVFLLCTNAFVIFYVFSEVR